MQKLKFGLRFLGLVLVLNLVRYTLPMPLESWLIFPGLFGAMEASSSYFNTSFTTFDWVTSYAYNFAMWFIAAWQFALLRPVLQGNDIVRSLKSFSISWLFFASVSAIYMNHYSHTKAFYAYNILDAAIVFTIVAVANGLLYKPIVGAKDL